jgi:hypothetical protein
LAQDWVAALKQLLVDNKYLEKNFCFLGFPNTPRNLEYLCEQLNQAVHQINIFNQSKIWQNAGLKSYIIEEHFSLNSVRFSNGIGDDTYDPSTFLDKDGRFRSASIQIYNLYNYGYDQKADGTLDRSRGYFNRTEVIYQFKNELQYIKSLNL